MTPAALRARRVALGLTQGDVARLLGVNDRTVRRWEAGDMTPPPQLPEQLAALAEQLGDISRRWVVAGQVTIPTDQGGLPAGLWWAAAGRALEVLGDIDVTVEPTPVRDGRRSRQISPEAAKAARRTGQKRTVDEERIVQLWGQGWRLADIARDAGTSNVPVKRVLAERGLIPWPSGMRRPRWLAGAALTGPDVL